MKPGAVGLRRPLVWAILAAGGLSSACASSWQCTRSNEPLESERCTQTGTPTEAVGTAVAAGTAFAVVGCTQGGCGPGHHCNPVTLLCEPQRCGEGSPPCPESFECDFVESRCE